MESSTEFSKLKQWKLLLIWFWYWGCGQKKLQVQLIAFLKGRHIQKVKVGCFGKIDPYRAVEVYLAMLSVTGAPAVLKSFSSLLLQESRRLCPYSSLLYLACLGMNELVQRIYLNILDSNYIDDLPKTNWIFLSLLTQIFLTIKLTTVQLTTHWTE